MTAVSAEVREAIRRADLAWLTTHLGAGECTPAVLKLLVRHDDPRLRHWGLDRLCARIAAPRPGESADLARLLPSVLDGPPETSLLLAHLHERLWRHVPQQRRPRWREAALPPRVQIAWLRAEILHQPATIRSEPAGELLHQPAIVPSEPSGELLHQPATVRSEPASELLYQAVAGITIAGSDQPDDLVRELAASGDPVLRGAALRLTREGLHTALLAPSRAREHISNLLDTPNSPGAPHTPGTAGAAGAAVIVAALRELAEPWAAFAPFAAERLRPFLAAGSAAGPAGIEAAISAAARHGHRDLLWDVVVDEAMPPRSRQGALQALGDLAGRADIPGITAIANTDPLLFGGPAIACLRAMHRRGLFPGDGDAAAVVDLALADYTVSAADVATIMFTCRHEAFRALVIEDADDPMWPRRLELLVGLARQGGDDLPVGDAVTAVLSETSRPEPLLTAVRTLRHLPAESTVLDMLPRAPEAALHALEAIGGPRTAAVLAEGLGLTPASGSRPWLPLQSADTRGVIAPHLRAVRHRALELLWHLTDDPDQRRMILARLDPHDLPPRIVTDLGAADHRELALLSAGADPHNPVQTLVSLARNGDATTLPTIADILLRIVADLATSADPGIPASAADGRLASWDGRPGSEPAVPDEVVTAIHALGGRLHSRGKLRPFCLREAGDAETAGHALVATIALDLLDRPDLSSGEQAVLLAVLRLAPYPGTRARVHRLLRHRDRHVRKQVIALLAADASGEDAQALSASLIVSTAAPDGQTVRQALLALGHIRAHWAAPAIAACLDHPTMNVKKTAATVLVQAGTPAVVPKLLFWLGHHDNPGLRATLIEALRTILGDAYAATVLAAAEQVSEQAPERVAEQSGERAAERAGERAGDGRTRELLLDGLDWLLSARAVNALAQQGSPIAPALLTMVATGRLRLSSGTVTDLTAQLVAHDLTVPPDHSSTTTTRADEDVKALALGGWDAEIARRIVDSHQKRPDQPSPGHHQTKREYSWRRTRQTRQNPEQISTGQRTDRVHTGRSAEQRGNGQPDSGQLTRLRPMLDDWLRLAGADAVTRSATLQLVLRICPVPWSADEIKSFARAAHTLIDGLSDAVGDDRDDLLAVLESVAPTLNAAQSLDIADRIRALALTPAGRRSTLALLRLCGAVLTRADVEQALAAARLGPDPWVTQTAVLREAFTPSPATAQVKTHSAFAATTPAVATRVSTHASPTAAEVTTWRLALEGAARTPDAFGDFRSQEHTIPSRDRLDALADVFPSADRAVRAAMLDWMEALQPIDAPPWTIAEDAHRPAPIPRTPHDGDLDQPRSAAQRGRLLAALAAPTASRRQAAATALRDWPEPETTSAVLRAFLHGHVDVTITAHLAQALTTDETELRTGGLAGALRTDDAEAFRERVARTAYHLGPQRFVPLLLEWWEHGAPATRAAAERALRTEHADALAENLRERLEAGSWGFLDLLTGRSLLRTPALTETCRRLRAEGRDDLADRLILVDGPLRHPEAAGDDAAALAALRQRPEPAEHPAAHGPSRNDLLDLARTGGPEQIRRALTLLAEAHEGDHPTRAGAGSREPAGEPELEKLLADLLGHPESRVRVHAHRIGRRILDRPTHLHHTAVLLDDPEPGVVRSAIKTLSHASYEPAIPAIVGLLTHSQATVRRTAADGLIHIGLSAVPALRYASRHARPDRRHRYTELLDRLTDPQRAG